jgi:hypothetical protein
MAFSYITINQVELAQIKQALGAELDTYTGRSSQQSDIDTLRLTRRLDAGDLEAVPAFGGYISGYEPASVDYVFSDPTLGDVRIRISTVKGTIWFQTPVPERIVDHVHDVVRQVKGLVP